jgi:hypothetical protein
MSAMQASGSWPLSLAVWAMVWIVAAWRPPLVVLVGQKKAVAIAVKNVSGRRRWSKLRECLGGGGERSGRMG